MIKYWLLIFAILAILWLPYFILSFPGLLDYDDMEQMNELSGAKSSDGWFTLPNHHPLFPTFIERSFLKIGLSLFHYINVGVLLNNIFLHFLPLAAFSTLITIVSVLFSKKFGYILTIFFGIFPIFPLWSNAMDKTGYFTAFFIFFLSFLLLATIISKPSNRIFIALFTSGLFLGLTRNDGVIYVLLALMGSFTLKHWKKVNLTLLLSIVCIFAGGHLLVSVTHSLPTEPMESMTIPIQQEHRVAKYAADKLSKEDKTSLNKFFVYQKKKSNYNPEFGDVSKFNSRWPYRQFKGTYQQKSSLSKAAFCCR